MKRSGATSIAASFVRDVHREWTRADDEQTFVYCTFGNSKRGWVSKDSLVSARPDLAGAIDRGLWSKMRDGGRIKAKPLTTASHWFQIVHPDDPNQPVHASNTPSNTPSIPPSDSHDWAGVWYGYEQRVCELERNYSMLLAYLNVQTPTTRCTLTSDEESTSYTVEYVASASASAFDLEEFVKQHSFSEVSTLESSDLGRHFLSPIDPPQGADIRLH